MTLKKDKLQKLLKLSAVMSLFFLLWAPLTLAQSNFNPPTIIPGENSNIGGYGDACIGLANMIRTGDISLRQIPCFIKYFAQTLIGIAGSVSVVFVMIGGYHYVLGGEASKDEAKRTITYALIGLAVTLSAWIMVDIVLQLATE